MTSSTTTTQTGQSEQTAAGGCCGGAGRGGVAVACGREPLPHAVVARLRGCFSARKVTYIASVLTAGELAVITDPADCLIIARIKRLSDRQLNHFERLEPATADDRRLYASLQLNWLRDEQYLLSTRLGRTPTHGELFADFMRNHNGLRFRAYFAMKFPKRMKPARARQTA